MPPGALPTGEPTPLTNWTCRGNRQRQQSVRGAMGPWTVPYPLGGRINRVGLHLSEVRCRDAPPIVLNEPGWPAPIGVEPAKAGPCTHPPAPVFKPGTTPDVTNPRR